MSNKMTAQDLIYRSMIKESFMRETSVFDYVCEYGHINNYEDLWYELKEKYDSCCEIEFDFRYGDQEVLDLEPTTSSRHYEIEVRASKIDGVWVAWDFYYGGGKHGEPEAFDWISSSRIVECEERVVTKTEYVFKECT